MAEEMDGLELAIEVGGKVAKGIALVGGLYGAVLMARDGAKMAKKWWQEDGQAKQEEPKPGEQAQQQTQQQTQQQQQVEVRDKGHQIHVDQQPAVDAEKEALKAQLAEMQKTLDQMRSQPPQFERVLRYPEANTNTNSNSRGRTKAKARKTSLKKARKVA